MISSLLINTRDNPLAHCNSPELEAKSSAGDVCSRPVLAWRCTFLTCNNALRIWEEGGAGFNLPVCLPCGFAIATSIDERERLAAVIDEYLI